MNTKPGPLELLAAKAAAKLILFAAAKARKRGDMHEVNHALAAITAGNTGNNGCPDDCTFHTLTGRQVRALVHTLKGRDFETGD
jgi:hypothetical protein